MAAFSADAALIADEAVPVLQVSGRALQTPAGDKLVLKGVNKMFIWRDPTGETVDEIAQSGANAVRLVWERDGDLDNFEGIIRAIASHGMVAIPELHDGTTAGRDDAGWAMLPELVDWWVQDSVVNILRRYESHVILNIANELGKTVPVDEYKTAYSEAIRRIRSTGLRCPIMIDCNEYGKHITMIREAGPDLIKADPLNNVIFSVHTWWHLVWGWTQEKAEKEMRATIDSGLPFVIGEFSGAGIEKNPLVDYRPLLKMAIAHDIGYLVWSWGPGNNDNPDMDMTEDGSFATLHGYGREIVEHPLFGFHNAVRLSEFKD